MNPASWLETLLASVKSKADRADMSLPEGQRYISGEVYQRFRCDCDPWRDHGIHWVPLRRINNDGEKIVAEGT